MAAVPKSSIVMFLVIAAAALAIDLGTKSWVFSQLGMPSPHRSIVLIPHVFELKTALNTGALFSLGEGKVAWFVVLSFIALGGILYWLFWVGAARVRLLNICLALITAGILGNLYDRLGLPGLRWHRPREGFQVGDPVYAVRDWLFAHYYEYEWPIFNIADCLLVCSVAVLMFHAYVIEPRQQKKEQGEKGTEKRDDEKRDKGTEAQRHKVS